MRTIQRLRIIRSFILFAAVAILSSSASAASCTPPPPNLFAWYRGEGNALDSADSNPGTLVNGPGFVSAKVGLGFFLSGGTDYVALPQDLFPYPASGTGTAPFSFELWFSTTNSGVILGQQNSVPFTAPNAYIPALYVGTDGRLYASLFWDNFARIISAGTVNDGAFYHAAVTFDGTNEVLYLDGTAIGSQPFTQVAYATHYQYQLGTGYATAGWPATIDGWFSFRGILDEASVYSRALGSAEVAAIFNAGSSGKCPGAAPQITTQPASQAVALGDNASFSVAAIGTLPLSYQWQFNGHDLANSTHYVGATSNLLTLVNVGPFDAGAYRVVISNAFGSTNSAVVSLAVNTSPILRHRYSFNEAAGTRSVTDLVGGANGALLFASATAPFTNGTPDGSGFTGTGLLTLQGTNGYVDLPDGLVSSLVSATFEVWVNWKGPLNSFYQRIFDFGANDHGTNLTSNGTNYLALISQQAGGLLSFEATTLYPFGPVVDPNALTLNGPALPLNQEAYIALSYDPFQGLCQLYLNGVLVNSASQPLNALSQFADYNNWLGRSQWADNPFFNGQYNEFRLWEGTLTAQQIANHFKAGPDRVALPTLVISRVGPNVTVSWATNFAAGFQLHSTPTLSLANWQTVTNAIVATNGIYQVTLPTSGGSAFYRLQL